MRPTDGSIRSPFGQDGLGWFVVRLVLAAGAIIMAYALVSGDSFGLTGMTHFGDVERDFVAMLTNGKVTCLCPIH